jgi:hypothetical protein
MMSAEMICGVAPLAAILRMAEKYPVFPCRRHAEAVTARGRQETRKPKSPLTERGFLDASRDPERIRAWWTRWPEALVGVPTGHGTGLIVVDYDHGKVDQAAQEWVGEHSNHLLATKVHETLNGGRHYVFAAPPGTKYGSSTNLVLGGERRAGIDLRGEGGYIIWWPIHGGNQTNVIMPLPAGLIDEYRVDVRELPPLPKGSPEKWRRDRARTCDALSYVDPSEYDDWLRVGMALHLASGGSDDGFELWHAWSSGGLTGETPRTYGGVDVCREKWASFLHDKKRDKTATLGTVFHRAKAAGWKASPQSEREPPPIDESDYSETAPADTESEKDHRVVLRPIHEIVAEQREPEWLIDDVIEANVLAVLAGPRSTFKSFVALDWAMRTAMSGQAVVILSGEGAGLDRRVDAWMRTHASEKPIEDLPVFALERALNLNEDLDMVSLRGAIERLGRQPAMVVIDTLSKFSAGVDENDNGEMSTYLAKLSEHIRQQLGATVLLVAHSGHGDAKRPRGASALMANPDAEYIIERQSPTAMTIAVSRERFKDCPALPALGYEAKVIDLGRVDRRGKPVTSLALVTADVVMPSPKREGGRNQERALIALREYHRANPDSRFLTSADLSGILGAQGLRDRRRRPEVIAWLVASGILTNSIGGHAFDPTNL